MTPSTRLPALVTLATLIAACDPGAAPTAPSPSAALSASSASACQPTPLSGTTALHVNESVVGGTVDLGAAGCTVAFYFDADAPRGATVRGVTVLQTAGTNVSGSAVLNDGGAVTVTGSRFVTQVTGQFVPIRFQNGATGTISRNGITGTHRVGILLRGSGTHVDVLGNEVAGSGVKPSGWAENGLQIDQGATASVVNNTFSGHWWNGSTWASTAVLVYSSGSTITNNDFVDNEFSILLFGDENRATGNRTSASVTGSPSSAWGVLIAGSRNQVGGNRITAVEGAGGIYIYPGSSGNRFTGNRISGFAWEIVDGGTDNVVRGKPTPVY